MQFRSIIRIVGLLLALFSVSMLAPALVALIYRDGAGVPFVSTFFVLLLCGGLFWFPNRHHKHELKARDGFLIVVLFWTVIGSAGALPFLLAADPNISVTDAFFESFSALTTTGATVIVGLDELPKAILFYRQFLQWFGGMGIIVLAVAILPVLLLFSSFIGGCAGSTGGGMKVIRVLLLTLQGAREMKRLVHPRAIYPIKLGGRALSQRVVDAVWGFFSAYALVFVVCMLALIATGMDELSAFSAVAATLNNLGPGLGEVAVHFADVNDKAKWILIASMLFGRLEIFTLLILLTPTFWRS
ncbi:TPA: hypothetical protein I6Z48_003040 [Vibrio cholerae]|nr:hypothetical protein [Vibrio cholerae]